MKRGVVITTSEATKDWLPECLDSFKMAPYSVLVVGNGGFIPQIPEHLKNGDIQVVTNEHNGWEVGGIARGAEVFDEFVHLMDTCKVKDVSMFEIMFEHPGSVCLCPGFFSYLGKYRSSVLNDIGIPVISDKEEAITAEYLWNRKYLEQDLLTAQFFPELPITTTIFEEKHGRMNMVCENPYIIKYKATHR